MLRKMLTEMWLLLLLRILNRNMQLANDTKWKTALLCLLPAPVLSYMFAKYCDLLLCPTHTHKLKRHWNPHLVFQNMFSAPLKYPKSITENSQFLCRMYVDIIPDNCVFLFFIFLRATVGRVSRSAVCSWTVQRSSPSDSCGMLSSRTSRMMSFGPSALVSTCVG